MEETRRKQAGDRMGKSHHLQEMNQAVYLYVLYQLNDAVQARLWKAEQKNKWLHTQLLQTRAAVTEIAVSRIARVIRKCRLAFVWTRL